MVAECTGELPGQITETDQTGLRDVGEHWTSRHTPSNSQQKIIFTPQTYLWLDEFVDCPYFVDKAKIIVTMEKMALQLMLFAGDVTKYGLARAMSKADEQESQ
jgi:hypothetical protein